MSSPPTDSWSSSLTWSRGGKYIWLRSEVLSVQCLMTAFIFWAWCLCCSCLTMCTCPVSCYMINTLIHGSAACCVIWITHTTADHPNSRKNHLVGQPCFKSHQVVYDLYRPLLVNNRTCNNTVLTSTVICKWHRQSHSRRELMHKLVKLLIQ